MSIIVMRQHWAVQQASVEVWVQWPWAKYSFCLGWLICFECTHVLSCMDLVHCAKFVRYLVWNKAHEFHEHCMHRGHLVYLSVTSPLKSICLIFFLLHNSLNLAWNYTFNPILIFHFDLDLWAQMTTSVGQGQVSDKIWSRCYKFSYYCHFF
jgi:hypothetical protein